MAGPVTAGQSLSQPGVARHGPVVGPAVTVRPYPDDLGGIHMKHKLALLGAAAVLLGGLGAAAPAATATPEHTATVAAPAKCPEPTSGHPEISMGDTGTAVKHAQCILRNGLGLSAVEVDGIFGTNTEKGVKLAQKKCEITVDGIVGPKTWACLHKFN